ncbi:MAG: chemotaxis protein CheB [Polyangiales bacterium]
MVPPTLSPRRPLEAVVIGGSAGAVSALGEILPGLPADFPPVLIVVHIPASSRTPMSTVFAERCAMRVCEAEACEPLERGTVYFAPRDYHLLVESDRHCALSIEPPLQFSRPAIDVLFESAAPVFASALVGLVLSGANSDGARGLSVIHAAGGTAIVQAPEGAEVDVMPLAAIAAVPRARVVAIHTILEVLKGLAVKS